MNRNPRLSQRSTVRGSGPAARIIDVNLNRLTEGLRVVEDVVRLDLEDRPLLAEVRKLRTGVGGRVRMLRREFIFSRRSEDDPGREEGFDRTVRADLEDVLLANFKRAEESARVLEEVLKVAGPEQAGGFKTVRFRLYDLEWAAVESCAKRKAATDKGAACELVSLKAEPKRNCRRGAGKRRPFQESRR